MNNNNNNTFARHVVSLTLNDRELLLLQTLAGICESVAAAVVNNSALHDDERTIEARYTAPRSERSVRRAQKDELIELLGRLTRATYPA